MYGITTESGTEFIAENPTITESGQLNELTNDQSLAMLFFSEEAAIWLADIINKRTGIIFVIQPNM